MTHTRSISEFVARLDPEEKIEVTVRKEVVGVPKAEGGFPLVRVVVAAAATGQIQAPPESPFRFTNTLGQYVEFGADLYDRNEVIVRVSPGPANHPIMMHIDVIKNLVQHLNGLVEQHQNRY